MKTENNPARLALIEENRALIASIIKAKGGCTKLGDKIDPPQTRAVVDSWRKRGLVPSWLLTAHPTIFRGCKDTRMIKKELAKLQG
jgi:hypothetical protein